MTFKYLASPYSHSDKKVRKERYEKTMEAVAFLIKKRIYVYSPIVHCHNIAINYELPYDAEFWKDYNYNMMISSDGIIVFELDGWNHSIGVLDEINFAKILNLEIQNLQIEDLMEKIL